MDRATSEQSIQTLPICALPECDQPASRGRNRMYKCCCRAHAQALVLRAAHKANQRIDIDRLRGMAARGMYANQIAPAMGVHAASIHASAKRHKISLQHEPHRHPHGSASARLMPKENRIIELYERGDTFSAIAADVGETIGVVAGYLHRRNLLGKRRPAKAAPAPIATIRSRRNALGLTVGQLAGIAGVQTGALSRAEQGRPTREAVLIRAGTALTALEAGATSDQARAAAIAAAPFGQGKSGNHAPKFGVENPLRAPDREPLPDGCFAAHNLTLRSAPGRVDRTPTHVAMQANS